MLILKDLRAKNRLLNNVDKCRAKQLYITIGEITMNRRKRSIRIKDIENNRYTHHVYYSHKEKGHKDYHDSIGIDFSIRAESLQDAIKIAEGRMVTLVGKNVRALMFKLHRVECI